MNDTCTPLCTSLTKYELECQEMIKKYKTCKKVQFSKLNNYVIIDDEIFNGVSEERFRYLTKNIIFQDGYKPEEIDWKKIKDIREWSFNHA